MRFISKFALTTHPPYFNVEQWRERSIKKLLILAALSLFVFAQAPAVFAASCDQKFKSWQSKNENLWYDGFGEACVKKLNAVCQSTSMIAICRTCTGSGSIQACTSESDDLRSNTGNCCTSYPVIRHDCRSTIPGQC